MSSPVSGSSGGQPSATQPIATPWLSPKVVTRNMWPKVLKDIALSSVGKQQSVLTCRNARGLSLQLTRVNRDGAARNACSLPSRWGGVGEGEWFQVADSERAAPPSLTLRRKGGGNKA